MALFVYHCILQMCAAYLLEEVARHFALRALGDKIELCFEVAQRVDMYIDLGVGGL
jgi:hypothetical protein